MTTGQVTFWVRDRLQEKLLDLLNTAQQSARLTPGAASKIYGLANFFQMGVYGRVGCGGLAAIKQRQDEKSHSLSPALLQCFEVLRAVIHSKPSREFEVVADIPDTIYDLWSQGPHKIAQLGLMMVLYAFSHPCRILSQSSRGVDGGQHRSPDDIDQRTLRVRGSRAYGPHGAHHFVRTALLDVVGVHPI